MIDTTTVLGASVPNDRFVEIGVAAVVLARADRVPPLHALRPDHPGRGREPRDGDARSGSTCGGRSRSSSRSAARSPRSPACSRASTSASIDPGRGTSLLIFAFIVVVIGGFGSIGGSAVAAVAVGLVQQYANYYASAGTGDLAVVLLLAAVLLIRPGRASPRRWRIERAAPQHRRARSAVLLVLALVPKLSLDIPVVFTGPLDSPGTLQLLALCLVFAGVALTYDLLFGFTGLLSFGHALYFAVGVYVTAIALTKWEWGLWPTLALRRARRARAAARPRRGQPARQRDRVRDGDARVRPGGRRARPEEPVRLDGRRGGHRA